MRRVIYQEYVSTKEFKGLRDAGEAKFHQFSDGNYTRAVLELDDGRVIVVPAENIRFIGEE